MLNIKIIKFNSNWNEMSKVELMKFQFRLRDELDSNKVNIEFHDKSGDLHDMYKTRYHISDKPTIAAFIDRVMLAKIDDVNLTKYIPEFINELKLKLSQYEDIKYRDSFHIGMEEC